ncbi:hypothetical protein GWK47_005886 [Chionoecetes opilio]|uniref:Uncharacterized protein n=1 Tax=Chionoecetes opilio TaxID=41210 RepID=A0A8J5CVU9_CHIOP|nr:hypothetical protein GWK47_005886 [Chionoecetes opilio]
MTPIPPHANRGETTGRLSCWAPSPQGTPTRIKPPTPGRSLPTLLICVQPGPPKSTFPGGATDVTRTTAAAARESRRGCKIASQLMQIVTAAIPIAKYSYKYPPDRPYKYPPDRPLSVHPHPPDTAQTVPYKYPPDSLSSTDEPLPRDIPPQQSYSTTPPRQSYKFPPDSPYNYRSLPSQVLISTRPPYSPYKYRPQTSYKYPPDSLKYPPDSLIKYPPPRTSLISTPPDIYKYPQTRILAASAGSSAASMTADNPKQRLTIHSLPRRHSKTQTDSIYSYSPPAHEVRPGETWHSLRKPQHLQHQIDLRKHQIHQNNNTKRTQQYCGLSATWLHSGNISAWGRNTTLPPLSLHVCLSPPLLTTRVATLNFHSKSSS